MRRRRMEAYMERRLMWRAFPHPLSSWVSFPAQGFWVGEGLGPAAAAPSDGPSVAKPLRRGPPGYREQRRRFPACDGPLDYQSCAASGGGERSNGPTRMMPRATEPSAMTLAHEVGLAFGQTSSCGSPTEGRR